MCRESEASQNSKIRHIKSQRRATKLVTGLGKMNFIKPDCPVTNKFFVSYVAEFFKNLYTVGISKTKCPLRSRPPNRTISGAVPYHKRRRTEQTTAPNRTEPNQPYQRPNRTETSNQMT
ncbi:hypothetical protein BpHYR1_020557 [Brachionus plicatilis]|uniref:Uncharacterized protein n=1 Tax=Brachionus plicatilis TaxID=10195 RepID=A0A3M7S804_BRAPC|nr:hypothetical protein BpHYR1_020557 [Brachionus plicatilis]